MISERDNLREEVDILNSLKAKLEDMESAKKQLDSLKDEIQELHVELLKSGSSRTHEDLKAEYNGLQKMM